MARFWQIRRFALTDPTTPRRYRESDTRTDRIINTHMPAYKPQTFQERAALSAQSKQAALDKLRAKPPLDPEVVAARVAAAEAKEAALAQARAEKQAAREQAIADKKAAAEAAAQAAAEAAAKAKPQLPTEAEMKAARDARYAARKQRVGKK